MVDAAAGARYRIPLLGALTALGSLAIHMFVPAMPLAAKALHAPPAELELTLTVYLVGIAVGQIATGPLSDRFGRRPVLLSGATLFVLGSGLCCAAISIEMLLVARVVQALGASCGLVAARAIVGDLGDSRGAGDMALLTAIVMLSPMLAPIIGSGIASLAGWRAIFAILAAAGFLCGSAILLWIPETVRRSQGVTPNLIADWKAVAGSRVYRRNLSLGLCVSAGLYIFLAGSPFLFVSFYHVAPRRIGLLYGIVASGAGVGALIASRLATRVSARHLILTGATLLVIAASVMLVSALIGTASVAALIVPMALYALGGGLVTPNAMMAAVGANPGRIGTAVSLYGAIQMAGNALATLLVASMSVRSPLVIATAIIMLALIALWLARGAIPAVVSTEIG